MKNYLKLVNFEMNRFIKLYGLLLILIISIQSVTTIIISRGYMKERVNLPQNMGYEGLENFSVINITYSLGFVAPIAIGVAALLFYMFLIWYRDWFAKNTFIYRLLTLPTSRMTVYFAKLTTIMLLTLSLVAYQIAVLKFLGIIIKWIIPITYRDDLTVTDVVISSPYISIFAPGGIAEFFVYYGLGFVFVVIIFTIILLERSFRLKGIIMGVIYAAFCMVWVFMPIIIEFMMGSSYLYQSELFMIEALLVVCVAVISLWICSYLLKNKITV